MGPTLFRLIPINVNKKVFKYKQTDPTSSIVDGVTSGCQNVLGVFLFKYWEISRLSWQMGTLFVFWFGKVDKF